MEYTEVERRFRLKERGSLAGLLESLDAILLRETRQLDTYYNSPHRDFLRPKAVSEWLRLREEADTYSLNYKRFHPIDDLIKKYSDEFETAISDVEAVRRIFDALGFMPIVVVDKLRQEWLIASPDRVVVAIDQVEGAGFFVEFEFAGEANSVDEAIERLDQFVSSLGLQLGDRVNRGYPQILLGREY